MDLLDIVRQVEAEGDADATSPEMQDAVQKGYIRLVQISPWMEWEITEKGEDYLDEMDALGI